MFFFIGGIQPRTVSVDGTLRPCPRCGLVQARLKRVDHYLSLFFIPIFPVKRGEPVLMCERCGAVSRPDQELQPSRITHGEEQCSRCGFHLEPEFEYCPRCGARV